MAEAPGSSTVTQTLETPQQQTPPETEGRSLTIKLRKRKTEKKVEWTSDTVDNEHMGRRSSKCCCIYEKPRTFGESSSESEGEEEDNGDNEGCGNAYCVRGQRKQPHHHPGPGGSPDRPQKEGRSKGAPQN
ncbi:E3 ubiquitin-protein ligase PPP1R11 [Latimeria chalumnae]|uniref:E3 ubiquitin-protein ligase PPP1R11 n=1 Tax=Latimeria chalumnae TaxID=7897 RepID=UPI0006D9080E|nr:PREDICTED: protein phosphatase 1 regulatory subunit 11 [Latimeria chalumnae]|eukprot:XP_014339965.1 PREDICTED: protein phosphatase 1 regulatory subunit 11 [Latimeria chalumnae]